MKKIFASLTLMVCCMGLQAQKTTPAILRIEPPHWWIGMLEPDLQIMVYGKDLALTTVTIDYPGVTLNQVHKAENKNYLFIDLTISPETKPGKMVISFKLKNKKAITQSFELQARQKETTAHQGLDHRDVIYLVTPDRFVNGNPDNDEVPGMKEGKNRSFHGGRHGGDLEGVFSKIGYMKDLGVTALWLNPVLENDMPEYSYHGYATTDYYKVDPRYGSNELYKKVGEELHRNGMKLIMDMIFNHCGLEHWWMKDMPYKNWINDFPDYSITNHAMSSLSDPYATNADRNQMTRGWFVSQMPDMNQDNPFMINYLIQNSVWWIEYAGLDGIRMDTYPYNRRHFMTEWLKRIYKEYPEFYVVGEVWVDNVPQEAYWSGYEKNETDIHLNSITDFPLCFAAHRAFGKGGNVGELYKILSQDFLYPNPFRNKIFLDNHDMDRVFYTMGNEIDKIKLALTFLLTTRGIPQLFYGTEIMMDGYEDHGLIREDFPGGWKEDKRDAFTKAGRTEGENEVFNHIQKILDWRKTSDAIAHGTLKHFVPYENIYVYKRQSKSESVMVMINNADEDAAIDMTRFAEFMEGYESAIDILTGEKINDLTIIKLKGNNSRILRLNPLLKAENIK